jgi:hypothetical protein
MKKYVLLILVILFSNCNNNQLPKLETKISVKKELRPFFNSDKIDHYFLNISEIDFAKFRRIESKTDNDKKFWNLFVGNFPENIPEKSFEKDLLKFDYVKSVLSIDKQNKIKNVFSEKDSLQMDAYACVAKYRDIFLFKRNEDIIGIAKICFDCNRYQIIGSKINSDGFGLFEELNKLKNVVRKEKNK